MTTIRANLVSLVGILLTVLLAGCGQQNSASSDTGTGDSPQTAVSPSPVTTVASVTGAPGIEIDNYTLVSSTRINRTVYEYIYKADVSNWGTGDAAITATLASNAAHITVMEGTLSFGDVIEGATKESTDTFTIHHDRSQPFNEDALVWTVQATPLGPTTFELIDQALAAGAIDAETALVYKVYHEFNDPRLPAQYVGRNDGFFEARAIKEAKRLLTTLSPATQQILTPLLALPDISGFFSSTPLPASTSTDRAMTLGTTVIAGQSMVQVQAAADVDQYDYLIVIPDRIAIAWEKADVLAAAYAEMAARMKTEIVNNIWPKLTELFGEPATGKRIAIFIEDMKGGQEDTDDCITASIRIGEERSSTLAHELTHAILDLNYPVQCNSSDTYWLHEATATWVEHFIYPSKNSEHSLAPYFLKDTAASLNTFGGKHEYGAYLWFLYATQGDATSTLNENTQRVRATWDALASHNSLGAVNAAVSDIGGLDKQWPEFALYNWNRKQKRTITLTQPPTTRISGEPYVYYGKWDGVIHKARESTTPDPASGDQLPKIVKLDGGVTMTYGLSHQIRHLGAKYWHFDFREDANIRRVRLRHPYSDGTKPWAKVQVIAKLRNREWMPAQDWTTFERKTLCRDRPDEDFEELVVVISNSDHTANNILSDIMAAETAVEVSALGCSNWTGSVQFSVSGSGPDSSITETGEATNVTWEIFSDRFSAQEFQLTGGAVRWRHSGSRDGCTGGSDGGYTLTASIHGAEAAAAFGGMYDKPAGATFAPGYAMWGIRFFGVTPPDDYLCPDGSTVSPISGRHYYWLDMTTRFITKDSPGLYDSDPTGNTLQGSAIILEQDLEIADLVKRITYTWSFQKNGTYAGEPEL
ncbi:MAG: hypothetical protein OEQ18_03360 [Gammaproteobacteria bacterium]|nr:hypothetical protein [Gammaproteobacteria bacterium]MDH5512085.1 hypothetical protein [Gammaproteobacteria bacterium]